MIVEYRPTVVGGLASLLFCSAALGQTTILGKDLVLRSNGAANSNAWRLNNNGYVGTYITLVAPGTVNFAIQASGQTVGGIAPRMNLVLNDEKTGWDVAAAPTSYSRDLFLPAGTHFVRTELNNSLVSSGRTLTIDNLVVSGATVSNISTSVNALSAADTYIANYRKGDATVALRGPGSIPLLAGTAVGVDMTRNAFNFGTAVAGSNGSTYLQNNPAAGSTAQRYQAALDANFNAVVPENAGKWGSNSGGANPPGPGTPGNISYMNTIMNYAQARNMRIRLHNVIWGSQQPTWVNNMLNNAGSYSTLRNTYIPDRLKYYIGDATDGNPNDDPATRAVEIDTYNETYHTGSQPNTAYWRAYGLNGVAGIINDIAAAAASVGSNAKTYVNEYNVIQDSSDPFANWYREHVESLLNAGAQIGGIGVQSYPNTTGIGTQSSQHNAAGIYATLQNLSIPGKSLTLTEFGAKAGTGEAVSAQILNEQLRLVYGTPDATGFMMWGFWQGDIFRGDAAFYDAAWNPRMPLATWQQLMAAWDTSLAASVDGESQISFNGFFGDYALAGQSNAMTLTKGTTGYTAALAAPPGWRFWNASASGEWTTTGSWSNGIADGTTATAHFAPAAAPRNVVLNAAITAGQLNFDSASPYTIAGGGSITLDGPASAARIYVTQGAHGISVPIVANDDFDLTIVAPGASLALNARLNAAGKLVRKNGAGAVTFTALEAGELRIDTGRAAISAKSGPNDPSGTSVLGNLSIAAGASLDVTNNAIVLDYDTVSPEAQIAALISQGFAGGAWNGNGIRSSSAADSLPPLRTAIGIATNADLGRTTFAGVPVDETAVLLLYTVVGDANLDASVNLADFTRLAANFGSSAGWAGGDFNYDASVSLADFTLLAASFGNSLTAAEAVRPSAVPEPCAAALSSLLALLAGGRQRKFQQEKRL